MLCNVRQGSPSKAWASAWLPDSLLVPVLAGALPWTSAPLARTLAASLALSHHPVPLSSWPASCFNLNSPLPWPSAAALPDHQLDKCFLIQCSVLPLLCSPPSTRWDPMDICNQPGQAQVHYTYRPTNPLYLSKFTNSCNKKCRNGEIPGLANSVAQVSLRTYIFSAFCSGHCYHAVCSFPNMGTAALNHQCWARVSNLRLPRASH